MANGDDMREGGGLVWGGKPLAFGDALLAWGAPVSAVPTTIGRLMPEQLIVAAARSIMLPAFPVFQEGEPTLPSVVFSAVGVEEIAAFERTLTTQSFVVSVRAESYSAVVQAAEDLYRELRSLPGNRVRSVGGFSDTYADDFSFRVRSLTVNIQR